MLKDNAAIRALPIELESKDDLVRITKHCIETGAQPDSFPHGDYYVFFYYDKNDKQIKTHGLDEILNPNENEPSDKETIIAKAKEIRGGDWIIKKQNKISTTLDLIYTWVRSKERASGTRKLFEKQ